ncbi:MAG TPA: xanthine dehydrogenase family protein molybdopterin-binding subunit [Terriglobia bacterium]|nr:xanthine dehydrogenase family protein molybdopterin-binding subunit [Terriglobia bacterium]
MAKCKYDWPQAGERELIGKRIDRIDGPEKASGRAKYTYDTNRPGMLRAKLLTCPYAHAKIKSIDLSSAQNLPGVKATLVIQGPGSEIQWAGDEIAAVAAVSDDIAEDACRRIQVEYEQLPHLVREEDLDRAQAQGRTKAGGEETTGDPGKAFQDPEAVISKGYYGIPVITHCCLESHGNVAEWPDAKTLKTWSSTQNVSGLPGQLGAGLRLQKVEVDDSNIETVCQYIGGGFGSKFSPDRWGIVVAQLSKLAGKPVQLMLERNIELEMAGARPSAYAKIRVAAKKDGTLTAWDSESWGTGGVGPAGHPPLPYVLQPPNTHWKHTMIAANVGPARAWRAPNHPQACLLTLGALDDLAAKLEMDPVEFLMKNAHLAPQGLGQVYTEELQKAAELAEWKKNWHPRGDKTPGHIKRGMGVSLHTWGGRGHTSSCNVIVRPDGSVTVRLGSQDLGTGTRTVIAISVAETLGLPVEAVKVEIGDSKYPPDGASGGSTTVGGVSSSTRRGAIDALDELFAAVAPSLGVQPAQLEAWNGRIRVKGDSSKSLTWKQACAKLGVKTITTTGKNPGPCHLNDSGVGGVQIADVSVDTETGQVKVNRIVAAQDCGLVIDLKTAESQVYGALIMGICYSLFEEKVMDETLGRMLNPNMEFYKLAGIGDIGELIVHMMTGPGYDERGVIGLGEPPVISPGAAIANAVANAIGVRVSTLPLTPDKVLAALDKGGLA